MAEGFAENVAPTAAIRAILASYPFSIGLLREILQNSDDAKAKKQIFVLDHRTHKSEYIYHPFLASTQGPALIAFNDGIVGEEDWKALQNIHRSSKVADTSKIGKYGIGFRSCYHITDTPHILSGSHLGILDPQHDFAEFAGIRIGGVKLDIVKDFEHYKNHLDAFDVPGIAFERGQPFNGTIFRLPLRTSESQIGNREISANEISTLLWNFAREELDIALLFLRNVSSIELLEISAEGDKTWIASTEIDRNPIHFLREYEIRKITISTRISGSSPEEREWRIIHAPFSELEAVEALSERLGGNPTMTLSQHKLVPIIDLAFPLNLSGESRIGRLFTFLPLPLRTEFPIHINALFSLTQSRQNLRNAGESGIVKNSDDHALIEWNKLLFDTYIPQAWATLLDVLANYDKISNVFEAWPTAQADIQSGDYFYWSNILQDLAYSAVGLPVWPVLGAVPVIYDEAPSLLFASVSVEKGVLDTLTRLGIMITQPPEYITELILHISRDNLEALSPTILHGKLLNLTKQIEELNDNNIKTILAYLLSTYDCNCIAGLPLIPSVGGQLISLATKTASSLHVTRSLLSETEEELFGAYDMEAVSLRRLAPRTRHTLLTYGLSVLSLAEVDSKRVCNYLTQSPYARPSTGPPESGQIDWLNQFWIWAQSVLSELSPFNRFYLVPCTDCLRRPTELIFDLKAEPHITSIFELLGVPVLDPRIGVGVRKALKQVCLISNVHALLRALPHTMDVIFSEKEADELCAYFVRHLPLSLFMHGRLPPVLRSRLRSIPIFPVLSSTSTSAGTHPRVSINSLSSVRGVDPNIAPVHPAVPSTVWLNLQIISQDILKYLDPNHPRPTSASVVHELMLTHFQSQSPEVQLRFIQHLSSEQPSISRGTLDKLAAIDFVGARDGSLRAPKDLVDPEIPLAQLFPGKTSSLPYSSTDWQQALITNLRHLGLFTMSLTTKVLKDRIQFISHGNAPEHTRMEVAKILISFVRDQSFDCGQLFDSAFDLSLKWIPTPQGLESPLMCRDGLSHQRKTHLFDEAIPVIELDVGGNLRRAFLWDVEVPFTLLTQQFAKVLDCLEPCYKKVYAIVKELAYRNLKPQEVSSLRASLQDRKWVPTRRGGLVASTFALLGEEDLPDIGFHSAVSNPYMRTFLGNMGCVLCPSKETLLNQLHSIYTSNFEMRVDKATIFAIVRLLDWLPQLTQDERRRLIIPDTQGILRTFDSVCYNDVGLRACYVDIGNNAVVHPQIADDLADKLGLRRLGLIHLGTSSGWEDDLDMGEDLITTIRNRLREYTDSQLLLEFLANASDAGATDFNVLVDENPPPASLSALISPRCRSFQQAPSLVIHNNSVFSDGDFKGILRTGIGGKTARKDSIGQFGLGALTMFHVAELAMIVSRDQVLFLNPCKAHLSLDRVALRLPLSDVRRLYYDHLAPLFGLFDFKPPRDPAEEYTYAGTLFWLPLRSSSQFIPGIKPIFTKITSLQSVLLNFKAAAPDCLVFTSIKSIKCFERKIDIPYLCWSRTATRTEATAFNDPANIYSHTMTIRNPKSPDLHGQRWRVLSLQVNRSQCPPFVQDLEEQYRLRIPPVVRLAAHYSNPQKSHYLFSTLPLPITLDLPVHISGSFILASDRRSIRLDEYENKEAAYNRWLLKSIVPILWLRLLADRDTFPDNSLYWPGNNAGGAEEYNAISTMVVDAVYQHAAKSELPILRSKYFLESLSPGAAYLIYLLPRTITQILDEIKPIDAVRLPASAIRRLHLAADDGTLSFVTPKYIHNTLRTNWTKFNIEMLKDDQIQDLIDFLLGSAMTSDSLDGLPILPLENGNFAAFSTSLEDCFFVVPIEVFEAGLFQPHKIVRRSLNAEKLLKVTNLNVKRINDANVHSLLGTCFSRTPTMEDTRSSTNEWIKKFWKIFPSLGINLSSISTYPLIQSLTPGLYVSLDECQTSAVIVSDFFRQEVLSQCFIGMGFTLVDTGRLSTEIRSSLTKEELTVAHVTTKLVSHCGRNRCDVAFLFNSLRPESRARFVTWIKSGILHKNKRFFQTNPQYRLLPLWSLQDDSVISANDALMLPPQVEPQDVAPFSFEKVVGYTPLLSAMGKEYPPDIMSILNIPSRLEEHSDAAYQKLLRVLLAHTPPQHSIPVPNSHRAVKNANELYSSQDDLFMAAFGSDSGRFLLPSFRNIESYLERFGLKRQRDLTIDMFKDCAEVFQSVLWVDRSDRAAVIFRSYAEDLPLRVDANAEFMWQTVDGLRFIPRETFPQPLAGIDASKYISPHVHSLPDVVSPNELVRGKLMAIAWSQRGLYATQPHDRLLMSHSRLSIPSSQEVVNHLDVLVKVAQDHPRNPSVIKHLEETYLWLNEHSEDAEPFLKEKCGDRALFLNVDDPRNVNEEWNWKRADHILLDTYDTGFLQCPRKFLKHFCSLLAAAGAVDINYEGATGTLYTENDSRDYLSDLRINFDSMRANGICTDVSFTCDSPEDKPLHAHRAYLAAYSDHFRGMFSGEFKEGDVASANKPIIIPIEGHTRRCVECVLDFAYTAEVPELDRTESDTDLALEILTLSNAWSMAKLHRALQNVIMDKKMVDPFNLDHVRTTAERAQATELVNHCERFEEKNKKLVSQARETSAGLFMKLLTQ